MPGKTIAAALLVAGGALVSGGMMAGSAAAGASWLPTAPGSAAAGPLAPGFYSISANPFSAEWESVSDSMAADNSLGQLVALAQVATCQSGPGFFSCDLVDTTYVSNAVGTWVPVFSRDAFGTSETGGVPHSHGFNDSGAVVVWDTGLQRVVMLQPCPSGTCVSVWAGARWIARPVAGTSPPANSAAGAADDLTHTSLLVVEPAGVGRSTTFRLSGTLAGLRWQVGPVVPASVSGEAAAFVPTLGGVVVFDGSNTWLISGTSVRQLAPSGSPTPRSPGTYALAYDLLHRDIVLFGGRAPVSGTNLTDTWLFDGRTWKLVPTRLTPPIAGPMTDLSAAGGIVMMSRSAKFDPTGPSGRICTDALVCAGAVNWVFVAP